MKANEYRNFKNWNTNDARLAYYHAEYAKLRKYHHDANTEGGAAGYRARMNAKAA